MRSSPNQEIDVLGNGISIVDGDTTPSGPDGTEFGTVLLTGESFTHTFTIENDGAVLTNLDITSITSSLPDFTASAPVSNSIVPGGNTTFTVTFDPSILGEQTATITINNNDGDENPYTFDVHGVGLADSCFDMINTSFELPGAVSDFFVLEPSANVPGWESSVGDIELWEMPFVITDAYDGEQIAELEVNGLTAYYQDFTTASGQTIYWSIAHYERPFGATDETLEIFIGPVGGVVSQGQYTTNTEAWSVYTGSYVVPNGQTTTRLEVRSVSPNDGAGNLIDLFRAGAIACDPEIDVAGNGNSIADGDNTPDPSDDTDFGTFLIGIDDPANFTNTFTISNTGDTSIDLTGTPLVSLSDGTHFSVTVDPTTPIAPAGSTTFDIQFNPTTSGLFTVTVTIDNNDADEDPYTFDIQGLAYGSVVIDPVPNPASISEFGPTATTFGVQLLTQPSGEVTISITPDAQCTILASAGVTVVGGVGSLVLDDTTWNIPVPVSVEAVDDLDIEGAHECVLNFAITNSTAVDYPTDLVIPDLNIPVEDNDGDSNFAKQFQYEGPLPTFSTVNLFFTLRNTNGGTLYDVTFTDELPENLTLASISAQVTDLDGEVSADCGDLAPSEDTVVGGSIITFAGGTLESGAICEVRVVVTSQFPGTYTNGPDNITEFAADGNPDLEVAFEPTSVTFEYADSEVFGGNGTEVAIDPSLDVFDPAISKIGVLQPGQTGVTGEQLEWVVTVTNPSTVTGTNVVITDTINSSMTVDNVVASGGDVNINGQTVTVTYATLAAGQSVSFSVFTTVVDGLFLDNTACMVADGVAEKCTSASVVSTELPDTLPKTGESPFSALRLPMLILLGLALLVSIRWRRDVTA